MSERYINVRNIRRLCDPNRDNNVPMLTAEEIAETFIVRCGECVHMDKTYRNELIDGICNYWNCHEVMDDWYCSQAQRGKQDG